VQDRVQDSVQDRTRDGSAPEGSARNTTLAHLVEQVRAARELRRPLCIRGGGTKDFYGEAPRGDLLDVRAHAGIVSHEPSELVVTARAGTPLRELELALGRQNQCLAFEPPRLGASSTVGGMVAAGLSGPARASVGSVRDFVLGAVLINGRAEVLRFGGQVMKNVAGYDVSRVLAGSLGILGVIAEVSLKVLPLARSTLSLRFEGDQARAISMLQQLGGQAWPLSASAWCDNVLMLRFSGAQAAVVGARKQLGGQVLEGPMADAFWDGLRDQRDAWFARAGDTVHDGATLWRLAVPAGTPPLTLEGPTLLEWGGAQRWLVSRAPVATVRHAAQSAGGHATIYHTRHRVSGVFTPLDGPLATIHRNLKQSFDPDRVFNPGRLYADL
jgi:glycolate oxidase FAD binding subunit